MDEREGRKCTKKVVGRTWSCSAAVTRYHGTPPSDRNDDDPWPFKSEAEAAAVLLPLLVVEREEEGPPRSWLLPLLLLLVPPLDPPMTLVEEVSCGGGER